MTETTVAYHVEDGTGRPAINVKDRHMGVEYIIAAQRLMGPLATETGDPVLMSPAYSRIVSDFWQAATEIAEQRGLGEIEQQGRSGGWLVFTDGRDPAKMGEIAGVLGDMLAPMIAEERAEWLAAYRAMTEWADAWIADAPRKVAALAQQYAMDEAGEAAARRMFATFRAVRA